MSKATVEKKSTMFYRVAIQSGMAEHSGLEFFDLIVTNEAGHKRMLKLNRDQYIPQAIVETPEFVKSLKDGSVFRAMQKGWLVEETEQQRQTYLSSHGENSVITPGTAQSPKSMTYTELLQTYYSDKRTPELSQEIRERAKKMTNSELVGGPQIPEILEELKSRIGHSQDLSYIHVHDNSTVAVVNPQKIAAMDTHVETANNPDPQIIVEQPKKTRKPAKNHAQHDKLKADKEAISGGEIKTVAQFEQLAHFMKLSYIKTSSDKMLLNDIIEKSASGQIKNNASKRLNELK